MFANQSKEIPVHKRLHPDSCTPTSQSTHIYKHKPRSNHTVDPTAWQTQAREWKLEHGIEIYLQPDQLVEVDGKTTEETEEDERLDYLLDPET
jgi:hypothetical protein